MVNVNKIISNDFKLSNKASDRIKFLLKDEQGSFFRISVLGGGCSGFQYNFSFEIMPNKDDIIFHESGIDYLIDKVSIDFIKGSTLEYISELSGSYFQIVNPNATANCGCGTSFSI
ncbi:iron-sulfur cluster assembly accessory protein [Alphaproteobacteria bacterium]|nr:iron-sulfur cluster assembly accessory protein [Alphaproteobacteria bacterium]